MFAGRKDWSALSSLTRQWSLEDEEEQQRERRRRQRALSSTSEETSPHHTSNGDHPATERLQSPEKKNSEKAETPQHPGPTPEDEEQDVQSLLRKRRQMRQVGAARSSILEQPEAEEAPGGSDPPQAQPKSPGPKELDPHLPGRLKPERHDPSAQEEESQEDQEPGGGKKGITNTSKQSVLEKPVTLEKRMNPEETPISRKSPAAEKTSVPKSVLERKPSIRERSSAFERPSISKTVVISEKKSSILERYSAFEKSLAPGEKSVVLERLSNFEKTPAPGKKSAVLERSSALEKPPAPGEKSLVLERSNALEKSPASGEKSLVLERSSALEKSPTSGDKCSVLERSNAFEKSLVLGEKSSVLERSSAFEKPPALGEKFSVLGRSSAFQKSPTSGEKSLILERSGAFQKPLTPGKSAGMDRKLVFEKAQMFERPPGSEKAPEPPKPAPRRTGSKRLQAQEQPAPEGNLSPPEDQKVRTLPDKEPNSSSKPGDQGAASQRVLSTRFPPITLQVKIPSGKDNADGSSPTQATFSSSLKRSSPRTISFRMSPRRENTEALTRSASMRLPTSSGIGGSPGRGEKLQETLQKYRTAVQRAESIKSSGSTRTEFLVTSSSAINVANKRNLFEKELVSQSRAEMASNLRDNPKLSGAVTSKLSLWVSRSQESEQALQEMQKESAATKRLQQETPAEVLLDAEV